jgi:filamentous hemagglutinin family protein
MAIRKQTKQRKTLGHNAARSTIYRPISSTLSSTISKLSWWLISTPLLAALLVSEAQAQRISPANDGTGTRVNVRGDRLDITGGRQSRDNANLFHSFDRFGLSRQQVANFLSNPEIRNILVRVVGGDPSVINGRIDVTGGNSNLFLMNPAGVVFGANAQLNVPASFTATTANGVQLNSRWFSATGTNDYSNLTGNPTGFAFTTGQGGAIANSGNLSVNPEQSLALVGGTVLNTGTLAARDGQVLITSVPGENFVRISTPGNVLSFEVEPLANVGDQPNTWTIPVAALPALLTIGADELSRELAVNPDGSIRVPGTDAPITITPGSNIVGGTVDVSGQRGGAIAINGNATVLRSANLNVTGTNGSTGNVTINNQPQIPPITPSRGSGRLSVTNPLTPSLATGIASTGASIGASTGASTGVLTGTPVGTLVGTALSNPLGTLGGTAIATTPTAPSTANNPLTANNQGLGGLISGTNPGTGNIINQVVNGLSQPVGGTILSGGNSSSGNPSGGNTGNAPVGSNLNLPAGGTLAGVGNIVNQVTNGLSQPVGGTILSGGNSSSGNSSGGTTGSTPVGSNLNLPVGGILTGIGNGVNQVVNGLALPVGGLLDNLPPLVVLGNPQLALPVGTGTSPSNPRPPASNPTNPPINNPPANPTPNNPPVAENPTPETIPPVREPQTSNPPDPQIIIDPPIVIQPPVIIDPPANLQLPDLPPLVVRSLAQNSTLATAPCPSIDPGIGVLEREYTKAFKQYWGETATDWREKSLAEVCQTLDNIDRQTGLKPGVIYAAFTPVTSGQAGQSLVYPNQKQSTDQLELILVTATGEPHRIRVPGATRSRVTAIAQQFQQSLSQDPRSRTTEYQPSGQQLYQWLIQPVESELKTRGVETLVFIMDDGLRSLPVAALSNGNQFLVEQYNLGMMPSLTLTSPVYTNVRSTEVLAMGASTIPQDSRLQCPAVETEISSILQPNLWQGTSFLNQAFTVAALKARPQRQSYGIVHLTAPVTFAADGKSSLELWDGSVPLQQLRSFSWNLPSAKLLVLNACQMQATGTAGELGFMGLAAQSSVPSVLSNRWSVTQDGSLALISTFYRQLRQAPIKAEALRQAQLAMLRGETRYLDGQLKVGGEAIALNANLQAAIGVPSLADPYYWSAFTLVGSPW